VKFWKIVVVLALFLTGCSGPQADPDTQSQRTPRSTGTTAVGKEGTTSGPSGLRTLVIDASGEKKVRVRVEVADDLAEQAKGLMDRTALGVNRGMLFVYPEERELSFWMKDTLIPLSIAFIDSERRIIDIQDMEPLDDEPPSYVSAEPAQYALEVNQGFFEERGVEVGDKAEVPSEAR
jgi:uncharacterized membrane protein (UPF0127 family)